MQKVVLILLVVLFLNCGCSSTGFLGLAKESYAKQIEEENTKLKQELDIMKTDMDEVLELAGEIEQLEKMTKHIESKLDELPEETLRKLVEILENYLNKKENVRDTERQPKVETGSESEAQ